MGTTRRSLAHVCALALLSGGCALSHGREVEAAATPPEEMRSACEIREANLDIAISTAPFSSEACEPGPVYGWIDGTLVESEGVTELVLDTCPPAADCDSSRRCAIRLEGHEVPLAPVLLASDSALFGWVEPGFLRLSFDEGDCVTCGRTVLYARSANPATEPPDPGELSFDRGESLCHDGCGDQPHSLVATFGDDSISVRPGETRAFGDRLAVRLLSSRRDDCTDEPGEASWIAWLEPPSDRDDAPARPTGP